MPSLSEVTAANASWQPAYPEPVAVITGGTSGIGQSMVEAFAKFTKGKAHIYIVARNQEAADRIFASLPVSNDDGKVWKRQFIKCDVTRMKNIKQACRQISEEQSKINFLVISSGYFGLSGRNETEEGIDEHMAVRYYSRWKFIHELLPLLRNAKNAGEDARVLSVLAAGQRLPAAINSDDFGLKQNFSALKAAGLSTAYNDYMMEEFALQEPGIAFTHIFPGWVYTPTYKAMLNPWFMWPFRPVLRLLFWALMSSQEDCAQHMWYAVFDGKEGFFRRGSKSQDIGKKNYDGSANIRKALWEHTAQLTDC